VRGKGSRHHWPTVATGVSRPHGGTLTSCFLLTGHADQGHPEEQVDQAAPALRHPGDEGRDDDLGGHVELHGVGDENPEGEEQLDSLVQPANEKEETQ